MNQANSDRLFARFAQLYRVHHLPVTHNRMSDGFDCGDGWFALLWQLSE